MEQFRVVWEQRIKPKCKCCESGQGTSRHGWQQEQSPTLDSYSGAEGYRDGVYNRDGDGDVETRDVRIESAEITWTPHRIPLSRQDPTIVGMWSDERARDEIVRWRAYDTDTAGCIKALETNIPNLTFVTTKAQRDMLIQELKDGKL